LINSTLSDYMIYFYKIVVPAWIAGPVRARSDSAELEENPGPMDGFELTIHGTGYPLPAGMTGLRISMTK
jgi:hypothetical protein